MKNHIQRKYVFFIPVNFVKTSFSPVVALYLVMTSTVAYICVTNTGQVLFSSGSYEGHGLDRLHADLLEVCYYFHCYECDYWCQGWVRD